MVRRRPRRGRPRRHPYARRSRLEGRRLDLLRNDPRLRDAARVARRFALDPVTVLAEKDPLNVLIRVAAAMACNDDDKADAAGRKPMTAADVAGLPDDE